MRNEELYVGYKEIEGGIYKYIDIDLSTATTEDEVHLP
jgi:hypothetical protein